MLVVGSWAGAASAALPTEVADEQRPRTGALHLHSTELYLEMEASYERRRVGSEDRRSRTYRASDLRLEESVSLRLTGDLPSPSFLVWDLGLSIGLSQERNREEIGSRSRTESQSGTLLEHDFSFDLLPGQPLTLHGYTRQLRARVPRQFLPSLLDERREAGFSAFLREDDWTLEWGIDWSDVERTGNRADLDDETLNSLRAYADYRLTLSDRHKLRLFYEHQRDENTYQGSLYDFDTQRERLRLEHELLFGPAGRHRLDTIFRLDEESGDLARDEIEFTPRLTLEHSPQLRTMYRYSYYRVEQDAVDMDINQLSFQSVYRPSDQLRFTSDLYWLREAIESDLETYEWGGALDLSYRRPTAWGELWTNLAYHGDEERSVGSAGERIVRGEIHALDATRPVYLLNDDIRRNSIVAYDASRVRVFVPGVDYLIQQVGPRTLVYRTLTGEISDGELVYFDYAYRLPSGGDIDTHRFDLMLEHPFPSGFSPYYNFETRRQNGHGSIGRPVEEDRTERHRIGARYRQPRWSVAAEAEYFDDSIVPYDAYRVDGRVALVREPLHTLDADASASWFDFNDYDQRRVWLLDVALRDRVQHSPYLSSTLAATYRFEEDSIDGTTNAVDVECGLEFRRGLLEVDLFVEYDLLALDERDEGFGVWLTVRRDLSHLLWKPGRATR